MSRALTEAEMSAVVAYTRGELPEAEQIEYELLLKDDPELAQIVTSFLDGDLVLERLLGADASQGTPARPVLQWPRWVALAAAAGLVAVLGWRFLVEPASPLTGVRVAVLESQRHEDFATRHLELEALLPPLENARVRGGGLGEAPTNISAPDYLELASRIEQAEADEALASGLTEATAELFVLPLSLPVACSVVVLAAPPAEAPRRIFPLQEGTPREQAAAARRPAGEHTLPRARVKLSASGDAIDYFRGFVIEVGEERLRVFVGLRTEPLTASLLERLDQGLPGGAASSEQLIRLLESESFQVQELVVRER